MSVQTITRQTDSFSAVGLGDIDTPAVHTDSILEWRILNDEEGQFAEDDNWPLIDTAHRPAYKPAPVSSGPSSARLRLIQVGSFLLVTCVALLVAFWRIGERGAQVLEREVQLAVAAEPLLTYRPATTSYPVSHIFERIDPIGDAVLSTAEAKDIRFQDNLAVVQVVTTQQYADGTARVLRQEQVYRPTTGGWLRTPASAVDWGPWKTLETSSFRFYFVEQDRTAVTALVQSEPSLDEAYVQIRTDYGLQPAKNKVRVEVSRWIDGRTVVHNGDQPTRIVVASPAIVQLPSDLADGDALYHDVLDALLYALRWEVEETVPLRYPWVYATGALHEMQLRRYDPRQDGLRTELIRWIYTVTAEDVLLADVASLGAELELICWQHNAQLGITAFPASGHPCTAPSFFTLMTLVHLDTFHRLDAMLVADFDTTFAGDAWISVRAFETVFEYVLAVHGPEVLPEFIEGFREYNTWTELIPAVFGVTKDEFEAGWRQYLVEEYGNASDWYGEDNGSGAISPRTNSSTRSERSRDVP